MGIMTLPASERHVYGHLPDPEGHRRLGVRHLVGAGSYPRAASLESYLPLEDVSWNQGMTGRCFPAGTPILMGDFTERPIEEVAVGNEVFTHNGKRRQVTERFTRKYEGKLFTIHVKGYCYPLTMTAEHPICVSRDGENVEWVQAKDVQPRDFVLMPGRSGPDDDASPQTIDVAAFLSADTIAQDGDRIRILHGRLSHAIPARLLVDERFARLVGLFLAEGSFHKTDGHRTGVTFSFARHEHEYHAFVMESLKDIFGVDAVLFEPDAKATQSTVRADNATMARLFYELCGEGALHKSLSSIFFRCPLSVRIQLIRGWLDGDGSQNKIRTKTNYGVSRQAIQTDGVTSSEQLHRDMFRLSLFSGLKPGASVRNQESHQNAAARNLVFYSTDVLAIFEDAKAVANKEGLTVGKWSNYRRHALGFLCRVKSIELSQPDEPIDVFNFEVEGEHTYVANNIGVHNCVGWGKSGSIYTSGKGSIVLPSPTGIYKGARWIDRIQNVDGSWPALTDDGSQPNEADRFIAEYGVVPYDTVLDSPDISPADLNAEPALEELEKASATLLIGSYSIDTFASDFEAQIARSISSGYAVSFAIPDTDDGFENYTGGTLGAATGKIYGGHELFAFSYELTDTDFLIRGLNSWGRLPGQWGLLGKFQGGRQFIKRWIDVQAMSVKVAP